MIKPIHCIFCDSILIGDNSNTSTYIYCHRDCINCKKYDMELVINKSGYIIRSSSQIHFDEMVILYNISKEKFGISTRIESTKFKTIRFNIIVPFNQIDTLDKINKLAMLI